MASKLVEQLQQQFDALRAKREQILAVSGPMRAARDAHVNAAREIELKMNAEIKEVEKELYEIDTDISALASALGGRRMSDALKR